MRMNDLCLSSCCGAGHRQTLNNHWPLSAVASMTLSLQEPLHPETCLAFWHKAPVSVPVLGVVPCVRDGGNFPAQPELQTLQWRAGCSAAPGLLLTPHPCLLDAGQQAWVPCLCPQCLPCAGLCHSSSISQLGAKESSLLPSRTCPELVIRRSWETSASQEVSVLQAVMTQRGPHGFLSAAPTSTPSPEEHTETPGPALVIERLSPSCLGTHPFSQEQREVGGAPLAQHAAWKGR